MAFGGVFGVRVGDGVKDDGSCFREFVTGLIEKHAIVTGDPYEDGGAFSVVI